MKNLLVLLLALLSCVSSLRAQSTGTDSTRNDALQTVPHHDSLCGCTLLDYTAVLTVPGTHSNNDVGYNKCLQWLKKAYRADRLNIDTQEKQAALIVAHPTILAYTKPGLIRVQTPVTFTLKIEMDAGNIRISWRDHYILKVANNRPYKVPVPYDYKAPNARIETLLQAVRGAIIEDHQRTIIDLQQVLGQE